MSTKPFRQHPSPREYLRSAGISDERILQMSDDEIKRFTAEKLAQDEESQLQRLRKKSQPDANDKRTWQQKAQQAGTKAREETMRQVQAAVARAEPLPKEFRQSQFVGCSSDAAAVAQEVLRDLVRSAFRFGFVQIVSAAAAETWFDFQLEALIREQGEATAKLGETTTDWDALWTYPVADILRGKVPLPIDNIGYWPSFDDEFEPAKLRGFPPEYRLAHWTNYTAAVAFRRFLAEAWKSLDGLAHELVRRLAPVLHQQLQLDSRATGFAEPTAVETWRTLFDAKSQFQSSDFSVEDVKLAGGIVQAAEKLIEGQVSKKWLGRRLQFPLDHLVCEMDYPFTWRDLFQHVFATGATGSGKSSGPLNVLGRSTIANHAGILCYCPKHDSAEDYIRWATESGRAHDIVHITVNNLREYCFNALDWLMRITESGEQAVITTSVATAEAPLEMVVRMIMEMIEITGGQTENLGQNQIFLDGAKSVLRFSLMLLQRAGARITFDALMAIISSLSPVDGKALDEAGIKRLDESIIGTLLRQATERAGDDPEQLRIVASLRRHFYRDSPETPSKQRMSFLMNIKPLLEIFDLNPVLRDGLCGETRVSPDAVLWGKIVILDIPPDGKFGEDIAKYYAAIWKVCFQQAVRWRHLMAPVQNKLDMRPVIHFADEAQAQAGARDAQFIDRCRSYCCGMIWATQSRASMNAAFKGNDNDQRVETLLGNFGTLIFCRNNEPKTTEWASKLLPETLQLLRSRSTNTSYSNREDTAQLAIAEGLDAAWGNMNRHKQVAETDSENEQWRVQFQAAELGLFREGGPANDFMVDAFIFSRGRISPSTGKHFAVFAFDQNWRPNPVIDVEASEPTDGPKQKKLGWLSRVVGFLGSGSVEE